MFQSALLVLALLQHTTQTRYACDAAPEAEKLLVALPSMEDHGLTLAERMAPRWAVAARFPADIIVQIRVQDAFRRRPHLVEEWDRALALYRSIKDTAVAKTLEARLILGVHRQRARAMLRDVLERSPNMPWAHLAMVEWSGMPRQLNPEQAEKHLREFRRFCPASLDALEHFTNATDTGMLADAIRDFRRVLAGEAGPRSDAHALAAWYRLWDLQLRAASPWKRDETLAMIRSDQEALRRQDQFANDDWVHTLHWGYRLVNDGARWQSLADELFRRRPDSRWALLITEQRWEREHPRPDRNASRDQQDVYRRELTAARLEWVRRFSKLPNAPDHYLVRERSLSNEAWLYVSDRWLEKRDKYPDLEWGVPPAATVVAEGYVERKVRLERVVPLLEKGLQQIEQEYKHRLDSDSLPEGEAQQRIDWWVRWTYLLSQRILAEYFHERGEPERATATLDELHAEAARAPSQEAGRIRSLLVAPLAKRLGLPELPANPVSPAFEDLPRVPMPDFSVEDTAGRVWTLRDLKGRVTLINVWASWCGPCRTELPEIEILHQRLRRQKARNYQVITLNVDQNSARMQQFLAETKHTFPVLPSRELADRIFSLGAVPQTWLVDPQGRRVAQRVGGIGDQWIESVLQKMDALAK
jgi:thiol-disulfide isomerase/thioredoxin